MGSFSWPLTAAGRRVVPVCPYVKDWVDEHDDVAGEVDPAGPEHLRFLESRQD